MSQPKPDDGQWLPVLDAAVGVAGLPSGVRLARWRRRLLAVGSSVSRLERAAPPECGLTVAPPGAHALVVIASSHAAASTHHVVRAAAAVELAYRATLHHAAVIDRPGARAGNRDPVLDGDWSITQAAVLVAGIGPAAYRILVRGYGEAQLDRLQAARFSGMRLRFAGPGALVVAALGLARLLSAGADCDPESMAVVAAAAELAGVPGGVELLWERSAAPPPESDSRRSRIGNDPRGPR